jgi:phosphopantetheine adenylyltransferase
VPLSNLTPESAARASKVFESADVLVRKEQKKVALLHETPRVATIVDALEKPPKAQK